MIVDRRLVAAAVAALLAAVTLTVVLGRNDDPAVPTSVRAPSSVHGAVPPPSLPISSTATSPTDPTVVTVAVLSAHGDGAGPLPTLSSDTDGGLVEAQALDPPADQPADGVDADAGGPGDVAAGVAVALWSWRFDDPDDRLAVALAGAATPELVGSLSPTAIELDRRRVVGEVAWAFAVPGPPMVDPIDPNQLAVPVTISQHVTTATTPERVATVTVAVRLRRAEGGWQVTDVSVLS